MSARFLLKRSVAPRPPADKHKKKKKTVGLFICHTFSTPPNYDY